MLLREMTSSALAHSFKRFARLAVVGLALAGLAACGGGGGGSSTPAEETPTPTPPPACPQGQVRGDDGQCMAEIPITPTPAPEPSPTQNGREVVRAYGVGVGATRQEGEAEAIRQCELRTSSAGTCRVGTNDDGNAAVVCAGIDYAAIAAGHSRNYGIAWSLSGDHSFASEAENLARMECEARLGDGSSCRVTTGFTNACGAVAIAKEYAAVAAGHNDSGRVSWSLRGDYPSASAAANAEKMDCEARLGDGSSCTETTGGFTNLCGAVAHSDEGEDGTAYGVHTGATRQEAGAEAIRECELSTSSDNRGTCRVGTNNDGGDAVVCAGTAR